MFRIIIIQPETRRSRNFSTGKRPDNNMNLGDDKGGLEQSRQLVLHVCMEHRRVCKYHDRVHPH